ncbi:unnamed protein product [Ceratitis capitata]|uniref:(Mediterranean fruit fly) hypothetical protein n=2 Tax=Ceratitis capitata TaxID=7213 RepID=A0A811V2T1_CERCA|nr:unnamed protein product [Ceratitis capitata]
MPRPKNKFLRSYFDVKQNRTFCNNGRCENKLLSEHAGNIERHMRISHPELFENYINRKAANKNTGNNKVNNSNEVATQAQCEKKTNIEIAILEFFTKCEQPLNILEEPAFKVLVQPAFATLGLEVSQKSVIDLISNNSQKLKTELIDDLCGNLFSLKIDVSTNQDITLIGINVQYIKDRSVHIKSLGIKQLQANYTSEYVKSLIMEVLNEYTINIREILSITVSNDSNAVEAIKELNDEFSCTLGDVETTILPQKAIKTESNQSITFEEWLEGNETVTQTYRIVSVASGKQILQLCVEETLRKTEIKKNLEKCLSLMHELKIRTSTHTTAKDSVKSENRKIDCVTEWTTTYEMLEKLYGIKHMISPITSLCLNADEWNFVKEFLEAFKPIYKANVKLQTTQILYSELYIVLMTILFELESLSRNKIAKSLIEAFNKQKLKLLDTDVFNAAVFLDPRIRVCLNAEQKTRAKEYITTLYNRINTLKGDTTACSEASDGLLVEMKCVDDDQPTTSNGNNVIEAKSFCEYLQNLDPDPTLAQLTFLESDITMYERQPRLPLDSNLIDFWFYHHNTLSEIAHILLAIPCTEVSIEYLSTAFKYILTDKQNSLSASNIDHILRVKVNGAFNYSN